MDKLARTVLRPLLLLYYPPFRAETEEEMLVLATEGMKLYVELLAPFPAETLAEAWRRVAACHKVERWPVVAEIALACGSLNKSNAVKFGKDGGIPKWARVLVERHGIIKAQSWLRDLSVSIEGTTATIIPRTPFARHWIQQNLFNDLADGIKQADPKVQTVEIAA